jgi:hypothetical protein
MWLASKLLLKTRFDACRKNLHSLMLWHLQHFVSPEDDGMSIETCRDKVSVNIVSFRSPYLLYLLTVGVEVCVFHLITLRHTPQSLGLLWTRDRPVAETSTWQHKHTQDTNIHAPGGMWTHDPSKRSAADLRLRPRGHWDRPSVNVTLWILCLIVGLF